MIETLLGALLGGVFALSGSMLAFVFESRRWKREQRIQFLRERRAELHALYKEVAPFLVAGLEDDKYDVACTMDLLYRCPSSVRAAFVAMLEAKSREEKAKKYQNLTAEMKKSLVELDNCAFDILE